MPTTPNLVLPYPAATDAPNGPVQIQALALAMDALYGAWTAYTPVWTGSVTNPTIGNGTITGKWQELGQDIRFKIRVTFGSTSTVGSGIYNFDRPIVGVVGIWDALGPASLVDTSLSDRRGWTTVDSGGGNISALDNAGLRLGHNIPHNWAPGDTIFLTGLYEKA